MLKGDIFYVDCSNVGKMGFEEGFGCVVIVLCWFDKNKLDVEIWLDVVLVELFVDSGVINLMEIFFFGEFFMQVIFEVEGGVIEFENGEIGRAVFIW